MNKINWIIKGTVSIHPYIFAIVPDHPKATRHGYVLLHRVLMENKIGRLLSKQEIIHHIDGNTKNNNINNLLLVSKREHSQIHSPGRLLVTCICPTCNKIFEKAFNKTAQGKGRLFSLNYCSKICSYSFPLQKTKANIEKYLTQNIVWARRSFDFKN